MTHVGQVDLVELRLTRRLHERPHLDTGRVHVDDEHRHALVLHGLRVGAREDDAEARDVRERRPHLLPVQHPLVAVAAPHAIERLATSEPAPGSLNIWHQISSPVNSGPQVALLLLVAAVGDDRRRAHAVADRVARRTGSAHPRRRQLGVDRVLQLGRQAEAAVALGEVHPGEAEVVLRAEELGRRASSSGRARRGARRNQLACTRSARQHRDEWYVDSGFPSQLDRFGQVYEVRTGRRVRHCGFGPRRCAKIPRCEGGQHASLGVRGRGRRRRGRRDAGRSAGAAPRLPLSATSVAARNARLAAVGARSGAAYAAHRVRRATVAPEAASRARRRAPDAHRRPGCRRRSGDEGRAR